MLSGMIRQRRPGRGILLASFVALTVVALTAAACGDDDGDATPTPTPETTVSPQNCAPNQAANLGGIEWFDIFPGQVYEDAPWRVLRGQGGGPFVSVSLAMEVVGAIELRQSALDSSFTPADGIAALEAWAGDFYAEVEAERVETYGEDYVFESAAPVAVNVGTFCAITFGYTGEDGDVEVDRLAGFATFDLGNLYLFTAEYNASVAPAEGFHTAQTLADFEPAFGRFVPQLMMPPGSGLQETPPFTPEGVTPTP